MALTIPLDPTLTHYDEQVTLDGTTYTLEFRWNTRASAWFMNVLTEQADPVIAGIRIVVDMPLGIRSSDTRRPKGLLFAVDTSGQRRDPGIDDFGTRVFLLYHPLAEAREALGV